MLIPNFISNHLQNNIESLKNSSTKLHNKLDVASKNISNFFNEIFSREKSSSNSKTSSPIIHFIPRTHIPPAKSSPPPVSWKTGQPTANVNRGQFFRENISPSQDTKAPTVTNFEQTPVTPSTVTNSHQNTEVPSTVTVHKQTTNNNSVNQSTHVVQNINGNPRINGNWDLETIRELILHKRVDIDTQDLKGQTPLMYILDSGILTDTYVKIAQVLLKRGASIQVQSNNKSTPLHLAAKTGNLKITEQLVGNNANVNATDQHQSTPLHLATKAGSLEIIQHLLIYGANINAQDENGFTALHWAIQLGNLQMTELLLKEGALTELKDMEGQTPLHSAVDKGHSQLTELLLEHHANIKAIENKNGNLPLHIAVSNGNKQLTELLLDKGANIEAQGSMDYTPLHLAASEGNEQLTELLLKRGANIEAEGLWNYTPLHLAVHEGKLDVVKCLLKNNANIEAKGPKGATPLHLAAQEGKLEVVNYLLDKGADVNALNKYGETPAMHAQINSKTDIQQLLEEKSGSLGKMLMAQRLLAARFAITSTVSIDSKSYDLQGSYSIITYPKLIESFQKFFLAKQEKIQGNNVWSAQDLKETLDTLQYGYELEKTQDVEVAMGRLEQKQAVAIPTGWSGHSVGVVIQGKYLFKCNRGDRSSHLPAGILVYEITNQNPADLREVITQLISNQTQEYFEKKMDQKLGLQLQTSHIIESHDQSAGNCTWASAKLVLRATLYAQLLKKGMETIKAQDETIKLYKEWSAQDRALAFKEYNQLKEIPPLWKKDITDKINQKYKNKAAARH